MITLLRKSKSYRSFTFLFLLSIQSLQSWAAIPAAKIDCELLLSSEREYSSKINPYLNPKAYYTYGVEVEYDIREANAQLLSDYAPTPEVLARKEWEKLTLEAKREWILKNKEKLFPGGPKSPSKLVRTIADESLPSYLIIDETGNVELISPKISESMFSVASYMDLLKNRYGEGYVQASMGIPAKIVYSSAKATNEFVGLRFFLGEFDILSKLTEAYEKHLKIPAYVPSKSFTHPFLGPMTSNKANFFRNVVNLNRLGEFHPDVLDRISKTDASYKYTSGTVYRPDVIRSKDVFVNEVRDCVKDFDCLKRRLLREKYFLSQDLKHFKKFANVRHLDPVADFNLLPEKVQVMLKSAVPKKLARDEGAEIVTSEIFRNFAYPLLAWDTWLDALNIKGAALKKSVVAARIEYVKDLEKIATRWSEKTITSEVAEKEARIALAKFAHTTKIDKMMEEFLIRNFKTYKEKAGQF